MRKIYICLRQRCVISARTKERNMKDENSKRNEEIAPESSEASTAASPEATSVNQNEESEKRVEVVIVRHKQLFNLLQSPRQLWRLMFSLFLVITVVFVGLFFVAMTVKHYYPYNKIITNEMGATIMQDEEKEVMYWLFNTANLWANSGIEVQPGDVLTIQVSGATHTAVHHIVDSAKSNTVSEHWYLPEGDNTLAQKNIYKSYHMAEQEPEGVFLMQVLSEDEAERLVDIKRRVNSSDASEEQMDSINALFRTIAEDLYVIGSERKALRIKKPGLLHFAVNDVVLTPDVIDRMLKQNYEQVKPKDGKAWQDVKATLQNPPADMSLRNEIFKDASQASFLEGGLQLGFSPEDTAQGHPLYPLVNELTYYRKKGFFNAWYMDNVGSFLVVIERQKQ